VKAVNLIPPESRKGVHADVRALRGPGTFVVGVLLVVLALVTLYVMASKKVSDSQRQLAGLQEQLDQTQALATKLNGYTQFAALAQARVQTVQQIASGRFDWHQALSDLSRVVPANTALTSVSATVSPSSGAAGAAASSAGGLRGDITVPAFELSGCTATEDDVSRLMSRLRLIRGVSRVTLSDAVKPATAAPSSPSTPVSASSSPGGCGANAPTFDVVVFFQPLPTVGATPTTPGATPTSATDTPAGAAAAASSAGATGATGATGSTGATTTGSSQ
jgi:Tfp pilus assembly protein PilN